MRLEHDTPTHPEPHDAVIMRRDIIHPNKVWDRADPRFDFERALAKKFKIELEAAAHTFKEGTHNYVFMSGVAPIFSLPSFTVKSGETVTLVLTNNDRVEDLSHGICVSKHDVNFGVSPQETASATFTAGKPGVYWYYCPWFCHALHLEMRGRMLVTA